MIKNIFILVFTFILFLPFSEGHSKYFSDFTSSDLQKSFESQTKQKIKTSNLNLPFIANHDQLHKDIKFYSPILNGNVFITESGEIVYSFRQDFKDLSEKTHSSQFTLKEEIIGNFNEIVGESKTKTKVNIFHGNHKNKWKRGLPTYDVVNLGEVYDGIELKINAAANTVEKYFYVNEGANPEDIRIKLNVKDSLHIDKNGVLTVKTDFGKIQFSKPVAYHEVGNEKEFVEIDYLVDGNTYGFDVGEYDKNRQLIIDPILGATYIGGENNDMAYSIIQTPDGNVFVGGFTSSTDFSGINSDSVDPTFEGTGEAFIIKLDEDLENILQATYFGGDDLDIIISVTSDDNNIYATGLTRSDDLPGISAENSADPTLGGGQDGFVVKFNSDINEILSSTFIGGEYLDSSSSILVGKSGNIFIAGQTLNDLINNFPGITENSADQISENYEGFITKFDSDLSTILASTFVGGENVEGVPDLTVQSFKIDQDVLGNIYIVGRTNSSNFPGVTSESLDSELDFTEAFVAKFDSDLSKILAATYIGGTGFEDGKAILINNSSFVVVGGSTTSTDFPGINSASADSVLSGEDGFVARLNNSLTGIVSATYLGGINDNESVNDLAVDENNNIYATGRANDGLPGVDFSSVDFIVQNSEAFISILPNFFESVESTYIGGNEGDTGYEIFVNKLDENLNIFVAGATNSSFFPEIDDSSADNSFDGFSEGFVIRLDSIDNEPASKLKAFATIVEDCIVCPPEVIRVLNSHILVAIDQVNIGSKLGAVNSLKDLISDTEIFIRSEKLPKDMGAELISGANKIISELTQNLEVICSTLGDNKLWFRPDIDIFTFKGSKNNTVTITFEPDKDGRSEGHKVSLKVKKSKSALFLAKEKDQLPKVLSAVIKDNGIQKIIIKEQNRKRNGFIGDYCLTIESLESDAPELIKTRSVE